MSEKFKLDVFWGMFPCSSEGNGPGSNILRRIHQRRYAMSALSGESKFRDIVDELCSKIREELRLELNRLMDEGFNGQFLSWLTEMNRSIPELMRIVNYAGNYFRSPSVFLPRLGWHGDIIVPVYTHLLVGFFLKKSNREKLCEEIGKVLSASYPEIPRLLFDFINSFRTVKPLIMSWEDISSITFENLFLEPLTRMFEKAFSRDHASCFTIRDYMHLKYFYSLVLEFSDIFSRAVTIKLVSHLFPHLRSSEESEPTLYINMLLQCIVLRSDPQMLAFVFEMALVLGDDERAIKSHVERELHMALYKLLKGKHISVKDNIVYLKQFSLSYRNWMVNIGGSIFSTEHGLGALRRAIYKAFHGYIEPHVDSFIFASAWHFVYPKEFPGNDDDMTLSDKYDFFKFTHLLTNFRTFLAKYARVVLYRILSSQPEHLQSCLQWEIHIFEVIKSAIPAEHIESIESLLSSLWAIHFSLLKFRGTHHKIDGRASLYFVFSNDVWGKFLLNEPIGHSRIPHAMSAVENDDSVLLSQEFREKHQGERNCGSICPSLCFVNINFAGTRVMVSAFDSTILRVVENHGAVYLNQISAELHVSVDKLWESAFIAGIDQPHGILFSDTSFQIRYNPEFQPNPRFVESLYFHYVRAFPGVL